ncbi:hypothetical protein BFP72_17035 [Reichenbachiella sp. 5M10]|uniref:SRPBCC domain-containing protein n=1 Tax=Reichenbachiella sp. 5M10 TaxID=1889772 RepID=UPI000C156A39|nr:SRPBCC domain-containing protein [Reichenbachiella sp. 5M10]PIB37604.1 hypothetical protein BFP72_17035 [Reichenbachiella sp. 5M10]
MDLEIETSIVISASAKEVWEVLMDFENYPMWNPFVQQISGVAEVGEKLRVQLPGMVFEPRVLCLDHMSAWSWLGKLWIKGLFDGEHYFRLVPDSEGRTVFVHGERFGGWLVPLLRRKLESETRGGFMAMNKSLKDRVERMSAMS